VTVSTDLPDRAARRLLTGRDRIEAKAQAVPPERFAVDKYGDGIDVVVSALEAGVELDDDLLTAAREDAEAAADIVAERRRTAGDADTASAAGGVMSASAYLEARQQERARLEADDTPDDPDDPDDVALAAMDGGDRLEAEDRGQSPAEYVRKEYGINPAEYDDPRSLTVDIAGEEGTDR